ncbi:MAG: hypothetical protein CXR30_15995 [Geobacter sp.]|nr:MAG: hypothetical protein CXR30_15995 [Geobacter sp.]
MKPIVMHPAAEAEMRAAAGFYQECQPGLGDRFLDEVLLAAGRIRHNPTAWPAIAQTGEIHMPEIAGIIRILVRKPKKQGTGVRVGLFVWLYCIRQHGS